MRTRGLWSMIMMWPQCQVVDFRVVAARIARIAWLLSIWARAGAST